MFNYVYKLMAVYIAYCFIAIQFASAAILSKDELEQADLTTLQQDSELFKTIGMGITLSIAQCEGVDLCTLNVDVSEMQELINALDNRIDTLTLKQEDTDTPAEFQQVLATYVDTRDNYGAQLEKLKLLDSDLDSEDSLLDQSEQFIEPDFPVESARNAELLEYIEDELSLFEDEELEDDEAEWDLPDLPEDFQE